MKGLVRRWLGLGELTARAVGTAEPPIAQAPAPENLRLQVAQLREDVDFMAEQLNRLRGRITGGLRALRKEAEAPQDATPATNGVLEHQVKPDRWLQLRDDLQRRG